MNIAIDYDNTYTLDTGTWGTIIGVMLSVGHTVKFVTYRIGKTSEKRIGRNSDILSAAEKHGIEVIFTTMQAKQRVTAARSFDVDVWIDDDPITIVCDAAVIGLPKKKGAWL